MPLVCCRRKRRRELVGDELAFNFDTQSEKSRGKTQHLCINFSFFFHILHVHLSFHILQDIAVNIGSTIYAFCCVQKSWSLATLCTTMKTPSLWILQSPIQWPLAQRRLLLLKIPLRKLLLKYDTTQKAAVTVLANAYMNSM